MYFPPTVFRKNQIVTFEAPSSFLPGYGHTDLLFLTPQVFLPSGLCPLAPQYPLYPQEALRIALQLLTT